VNAASGMPQPIFYEREVCRKCHRRRDGQEVCSHCPGKKVPLPGPRKKKVVGLSDWGMESVIIWDIKDLIADWLQIREVVENLFNHLHQTDVKNRTLDSERCKHYRAMTDAESGGDQRCMLLCFHTDGFAPLRSRPNDFSLTYGILSLLLGPQVILPFPIIILENDIQDTNYREYTRMDQ